MSKSIVNYAHLFMRFSAIITAVFLIVFGIYAFLSLEGKTTRYSMAVNNHLNQKVDVYIMSKNGVRIGYAEFEPQAEKKVTFEGEIAYISIHEHEAFGHARGGDYLAIGKENQPLAILEEEGEIRIQFGDGELVRSESYPDIKKRLDMRNEIEN